MSFLFNYKLHSSIVIQNYLFPCWRAIHSWIQFPFVSCPLFFTVFRFILPFLTPLFFIFRGRNFFVPNWILQGNMLVTGVMRSRRLATECRWKIDLSEIVPTLDIRSLQAYPILDCTHRCLLTRFTNVWLACWCAGMRHSGFVMPGHGIQRYPRCSGWCVTEIVSWVFEFYRRDYVPKAQYWFWCLYPRA